MDTIQQRSAHFFIRNLSDYAFGARYGALDSARPTAGQKVHPNRRVFGEDSGCAGAHTLWHVGRYWVCRRLVYGPPGSADSS